MDELQNVLVVLWAPLYTSACHVMTTVTCLLLKGHARQMSPFKHWRAVEFCLLYLQTLGVNKPGK